MDRIGIIGGTGLVSIDIEAQHATELESRGFEVVRTDDVNVQTEFGHVPLKCISIQYNGKAKELVFLQRHHNEGSANKPPHMINHKANIKALQDSRCDVIVSVCSIGAIVSDLPPGKVALAGQYIDFTGVATSFNDTFAVFTSVT
jgi:5'-methylthioadenosine phosphorylase